MSTPSTMDKARTQLVVNHAFFASIALKRPMKADNSVKTACINARGHIRYNPEWVADLTVQQCVFLIAHECMHWMMDNFARMGSRHPKKWNWATDACNNETLIKANIGEFINGGVRYPGADNMSAEEVYQYAPDMDDGSGDGDGIGGVGEDMDPSEGELSPEEAREVQAQMKLDVAQAAQAARSMGQMPAAMEKFVDDLLQPSTPWYTILERFMDRLVKSDYSWTRPNRRMMPLGLYLPSISGHGMGELAVIRDTSGSVSNAEQQCFASHLNTILESCQPTAIHVIDVDADVSEVQTIELSDLPFNPPVRGGGGTDMRVGVEYVETNLPDVSCVVLLTDGYTPWPDSVDVPMIVASTGADAPSHIAETVKLEVD